MRAMTLTDEMRGYHRQHVQLLGRVARGELDVIAAPALLFKVVLEVVRHGVDEEVFLIPEVARRLGAEEARGCRSDLVPLEKLLRVLEVTEATSIELPRVLDELARAYVEHARRQEAGVFRSLERLAPEELVDLGRVAPATAEAGPTTSHPAGLRLAGSGWPSPGLVNRLRDRLLADAMARRDG